MAWDVTAVNTTSGFSPSGVTLPPLYYSRWLSGQQDPSDRNVVHMVREVRGTGATDEVGFYYLRYTLDDDTLVRNVAVEVETLGAGDGHHRAPRVTYDVGESRLWVAWAWKASGLSGQDDHIDPGDLMVRYSDDDGATWSSRITVSSAADYRYPSINFGADGTGFIVAWDVTNSKWVYSKYAGGGSWGTITDLHTPVAAAMQIGMAAVAVGHDGKAVALIDDPLSSTNPRPSFMYWNGTAWGGPTVLTSTTGATNGMTRPWIEYHNTKLEYQAMFGYSAGSPNAQRYTISRGGVAGNNTDLGFGTSINSNSADSWLSGALDEAGNVHIHYNASAQSDVDGKYNMWTRSTNSLDTATSFSYTSQGDPEPLNCTSGAIGVTNPLGRVFFTGDLADTPSQLDNHNVWSAENPALIDLPASETSAQFGKIVRIADTVVTDATANPQRKLVIYVGNAVYHDANAASFTGNLVATGQFEPPVCDFAVFENEVYIADGGVTTLQMWDGLDGSTASTVTNNWENAGSDPAPKAVGIVADKGNRLWTWTLDEPRRALFSGLRAGDQWSLTGATLEEDDPGFIYLQGLPKGEGIQGIGMYYDDRIIFSRNGIIRITGDTPFLGLSADTNARPFLTAPISSDVGCVSHLSIVDIGTDLLFLSAKGFHSLATTDKFGDQEHTFLSTPIQDQFDQIDRTFLPKVQGVNFRDGNLAVWNASISGDGGLPRTLLVYDYAQKLWAIWKFDFNIWSLHTRKTPDQQTEQLLAGTDEGYVVLLQQASRYDHFKDTDYDAQIRTAWLGDQRLYGKFTRALIHLRDPSPGTITGRWWVDNGDPVSFTIDGNPYNEEIIGTAVIGTAIIGGRGISTPPTFTTGVGRWGRQIMFEMTTSAGPSAIAGIEVEFLPGAGSRAVN